MNMHLHDTTPVTNEFLSGRFVAKHAHGRPLNERLVTVTMLLGNIQLGELTHAQIAKLAGVSLDSVSIVANATPDERKALFNGASLRSVRKANAKPREMTDAEIEAFIDRVDPNRVLAILDRKTAPPQLVAAE